MRVNPLLWLNVSEMSWPNVYPAPRGEMPHPPLSSGSDHSRSHMGPWITRTKRSDILVWIHHCFKSVNTSWHSMLDKVQQKALSIASKYMEYFHSLAYLLCPVVPKHVTWFHYYSGCLLLSCSKILNAREEYTFLKSRFSAVDWKGRF